MRRPDRRKSRSSPRSGPARQWQIELTRTQEHLRVEQDGFTRSRDEFARSIGWLADAVSDLGGRLNFAEQQAKRADTAAAAAAERSARIEQHAVWADAQIAQLSSERRGSERLRLGSSVGRFRNRPMCSTFSKCSTAANVKWNANLTANRRRESDCPLAWRSGRDPDAPSGQPRAVGRGGP